MRSKSYLAVLAAAFLAAPSALASVVIIQPVAITSSFTVQQGAFVNLINQSGLTPTGYIPGEEYFPYVDGPPTITHVFGGIDVPNGVQTQEDTGSIVLDLGGVFLLQNFALWNGEGILGLSGFDLYVSVDMTFGMEDLVGSFVSLDMTPNAQSFMFDEPKTGRFVQVDVTSSRMRTGNLLGEMALGAVTTMAVPEPGVIALLSLGLIGFAFRLRHSSPAWCESP